jgi:hydrogenase-4 component F
MSFALLGTLFIFAAGQHGAYEGGTLETYQLIQIAPNLDYKLLRFGYIFCLLGYGTKAGMFPLHSWLPDAHSEAPAPSSALLSGSLLNCALFAIWRVSEIVCAAPNAHMATQITLWAGTLTVVAAGFFLIRQQGLKRLFAFSSIENVGVMLVAIALNSGALFFLQALNHSIAKVALFLLAGNIVQGSGKKYIADQSGLMASAPGWAILLAVGAFSVTGAPPFGAFLSELLILMKAIDMHCYANAILLMFGLALAFIGVCMHLGRVFLGSANPHMQYFKPILTCAVPALLLAGSLALGFCTSPGLWEGLK